MPVDVASEAVDLIRKHGLDAWVYRGNDWLVTKANAQHVAREAWTVKFEPKIVADVGEKLNQVAKIVGVSDAARQMPKLPSDGARRRRGHNPTISTLPTGKRTRVLSLSICRAI